MSGAGSIFPVGTFSGTPKIRAMEIIAELEPYRRNAYGGGIGFFHFNGDAQMAILIKTRYLRVNLTTNSVSTLILTGKFATANLAQTTRT